MKKKVALFWGFYAFALMLFCAGSSPFIDFMSTDSSVFFTMGRGMAQGKIPYVDFFDHKGWYIYFINFLGAQISSSTSIGIWMIESLFVLSNALLYYLISKIFIDNQVNRIIFSQGMLLLSLNYFTFQGGNFTETYALTFQLVAFFLVLKYDRSGSTAHPPQYMLLHGICVGIVFGLRANMIAMWGAIAIVIIIRLLYHKEYKNVAHNILAGFCGMLIGIAPPVLYGIFTDSLSDMFYQSILFNVSYSGNNTFVSKLISTFGNYVGISILIALFAATIIVFLSKEPVSLKILFLLSLLFSIISVSLSGRFYGKYFEYLIPFLIPFTASFVNFVNIGSRLKSTRWQLGIICALFLLSICCNLRTPIRLFVKTDSTYYTRSANEIADLYSQISCDGDKVLVTNNNTMYYNKMNVLPSIKHFYIPAIAYEKYPDAIDDQITSIISGENDVIILRYADYENKIIFSDDIQNNAVLDYLVQNYHLVYDKYEAQMWVKVPST